MQRQIADDDWSRIPIAPWKRPGLPPLKTGDQDWGWGRRSLWLKLNSNHWSKIAMPRIATEIGLLRKGHHERRLLNEWQHSTMTKLCGLGDIEMYEYRQIPQVWHFAFQNWALVVILNCTRSILDQGHMRLSNNLSVNKLWNRLENTQRFLIFGGHAFDFCS